MYERNQFTFYSSFYEAISRIKKAPDRAAAYDAICEYAIFGKDPDLEKMPDSAQIAFFVIQPILNSGRSKAKAGSKRKQTANKPEANGSKVEANANKPEANGSKSEANRKQEQEQEQDKDKEQMLYPPYPPGGQGAGQALEEVWTGSSLSPALESALRSWAKYKAERRELYRPVGLQQLLSRAKSAAAQYGDAAVIAMLNQSMAANYQGPVWDWLKEGKIQVPGRAANAQPSAMAVEAVKRMMNSGAEAEDENIPGD